MFTYYVTDQPWEVAGEILQRFYGVPMEEGVNWSGNGSTFSSVGRLITVYSNTCYIDVWDKTPSLRVLHDHLYQKMGIKVILHLHSKAFDYWLEHKDLTYKEACSAVVSKLVKSSLHLSLIHKVIMKTPDNLRNDIAKRLHDSGLGI